LKERAGGGGRGNDIRKGQEDHQIRGQEAKGKGNPSLPVQGRGVPSTRGERAKKGNGIPQRVWNAS